jgi:hypothetical protein
MIKETKIMIKWIFKFLCFLFITSIGTFAQPSTSAPIIYRLIDNDFRTSNGGYISVTNALTQEEINRIPFQSISSSLELSLDQTRAFLVGKTLASKGLSVIDLAQERIRGPFFPEDFICRTKTAPDGLLWVALCNKDEIAILNPQTLVVVDRIENIDMPLDLTFSKDGKLVYINLLNNNILIFDIQRKNLIKTITGLPSGSEVNLRNMSMSISPDNKILAVAGKTIITLIDTTSFQTLRNFSFPNGSFFDVASLQFSPDGKFIYIAELQGSAFYTYNLETSQLNKIFTSPSSGLIQDFKLSEDGKLIYLSLFFGKAVIDTQTFTTIFFVKDLPENDPRTSTEIALAGDFTIGQAPTLETTSPTINQQVMAGQPLTIRWNTTVAPQSFSIASHKIELSTDGGATFATIPGAEQLKPDVREFVWQVPDIEILNKVQIRVSTVDLGARRTNSPTGNFSIIKTPTGDTQAPMVAFLSPKGGERFTSGDNLQITWMSSDNVAVTSQDLSLSTDGGNTFPITLANGLPATTQSFSFPIPMTLQSDQSRLRLIVRDSAGNMSQALTPSSFRIELGADTIAPVVTIAQPTANQKLIAGQPVDVKWQSTDNKQLVSQALQLSLDGGNTFATLASFGASDNSFVINNIAGLAMTNAQGVVRITATDTSGNIGQASVMFSTSSAITTAVYQAKVLSLAGIGFISNSSGSTTRVFVNEREITITPTMLSNNSLTIKGNKKKLGISRGNNTVRLLVNGVSSNTLPFTF